MSGNANSGQRGEDRDPERTCKGGEGGSCTRWPVRGQTLCPVHGGSTPAAKEKRAELEIIEQARTTMGIVEVKPKDFPRVAAQLVGWYAQQFAALNKDLDKASLLHVPGTVAWAREYPDILDRMDRLGRTMAKLMQHASAMRAAFDLDDRPPVPPNEQIQAAMRQMGHSLGLLNEDGTPKPHRCQCCGQDVGVVEGEIVE